MKKSRLISLVIAVLLIPALIAGCGAPAQPAQPAAPAQPAQPAQPAEPAKPGEAPAEPAKPAEPAAPAAPAGEGMDPAVDADTVVIATADETPSLSTAGHNAVAGDYVNTLTHNGLFRINAELNPEPDLVAEYHTEKDDKGEDSIWIMKLHENIGFSDGTIMNADDVVATLMYAKTQQNVATYTKSVITVEKVDDLTVKITTDGPSATLLYDLSHHGNYILPKALIEADNDWNANPVGAGAYKLVEWKRGEQIEFTANEFYFNKERTPKIKNVIWRIIPEGSARTIALEAGEVDYIIELDSTSVPNLDANPAFTVMKVPTASHNWLTVNNEVVPFDDVNVRKAINSAINKEDVIEVSINGMGEVALSQTPNGMLGSTDEFADPYDVAKAKEYLAAWGGDPATIKLDMICSNDTKRRAAEVIQANLKEIGITANIVSMDLATYLSETAAGNFTGFIGGYTTNNMMSFLNGVFLSDNINASNKTRTNEPELDAMIRESFRTVDQDERGKILEAATIFLNKETPQMPLYQPWTLSAHKTNLLNTFITGSGGFWVQEWAWQ